MCYIETPNALRPVNAYKRLNVFLYDMFVNGACSSDVTIRNSGCALQNIFIQLSKTTPQLKLAFFGTKHLCTIIQPLEDAQL